MILMLKQFVCQHFWKYRPISQNTDQIQTNVSIFSKNTDHYYFCVSAYFFCHHFICIWNCSLHLKDKESNNLENKSQSQCLICLLLGLKMRMTCFLTSFWKGLYYRPKLFLQTTVSSLYMYQVCPKFLVIKVSAVLFLGDR